VGYGFTDRYAAEIELILEREPNEDTEFEAVEFENRFQFAEPGEYWLDSGLYLALEWKPEDDEYELESRILLEKSIDRIVTTSNIEIKHELFESSEFEGEVSIGSRYRYIPEFEPGVEAHFEIGELDDVAPIDEQDWSVGPMFHGSVKQVSYVLATLFGVTDGATDVTLRWELEYEW